MSEPAAGPVSTVRTIQNFRLEVFERLVYSRRCKDAAEAFRTILFCLRDGGEFADHDLDDSIRPRLYTRLAAAIGALITDPELQISRESYERLVAEHSTLHAIFQASAFGSADHLLHHLGVADLQKSTELSGFGEQRLLKLLLLYSLDSEPELDFEALIAAAPHLAAAACLGMLGQGLVLTPRASERRERLLAMGPSFERAEAGAALLPAIGTAYMYCSYAIGERKHEIKRHLNGMMRRMIAPLLPPGNVEAARAVARRPTLLVPLEQFTSLHAMYRCYAKSIVQLRSRFRVVAIGYQGGMDGVSKALFDEVLELDAGAFVLSDVLERMRRVAPDIVYYPSVGMHHVWTAIAAVRLAPIQIASLGHPASTYSDAIDYMIVDESWRGSPECFSESVIVCRADAETMVMRVDARVPQRAPRERPECVRVAIAAAAFKLNAAFLALCRSVASKSRVPLEFCFFPNVGGLAWYQVATQVCRWLPGARVHPITPDYNAYLANLARCDIAFGTFPFGGINSSFDCVCVGLPIVTLEGREAHSQLDSGIMRKAGLPEWLITHSLPEYETVALRLVQGHSERLAIARQLASLNVADRFMSGGGEQDSRSLVNAFVWINENHERIRASGRRWWTFEDREAFRPAGAQPTGANERVAVR